MNISVKNLTKIYGNQKAVDNISFEVKTGEVLGFLGPNGAGKTTTMKILTGFLSPDEGEVLFGNHSIFENQQEIKKMIGYLPESNPLYGDMGVIDYLNFSAEISGVSKSIIDQKIKEMIVLVGLDEEKHKNISELSKGYKQRVGLAQSLIHDPEIVILDEPTSGLDPNQIVEIRKLIRKIGKEKTVILSTHILSEVEAACDRIIIINKGKIAADGTAESLKKKTQETEVIRFQIINEVNRDIVFAQINNIASVTSVDFADNNFIIGSTDGLNTKKELFNMCVSNNWRISELTSVETKLEDIFRNLTIDS